MIDMMLTIKRNVSSNVTMNVRKNKPTERAIKMSNYVRHKFKILDKVVANESYEPFITKGKTYEVMYLSPVYNGLISIVADNDAVTYLYDYSFELKEEDKVNTEKEQYISVNTNTVYDVAFKGNKVSVLKSVKDGDETALLSEYLSDSNLFLPYTKEVAKQAKYKEDLSILETISETVKKNLNAGYVICHSKVEKENDLTTVSVVMGKEV